MSRSPSRNQPGAAPSLRRLERIPALAGAPPASLGVDQPAERVEEAVEIGRDVQPEDLEVVAHVADHGQLARREDGGEPTCEASSAAAARQQDDSHAGRRGARVCAGRGERRVARGRHPSPRPARAPVSGRSPALREPGSDRRFPGRRAARRRRIGKRERVRRSVGRLDQREARRRRAGEAHPASPPGDRRSRRAHARRRARARPRRPPRGPRPGSSDDLDARRHDRRVVRHDEDTSDLNCRLHDVAEHREGERRTHATTPSRASRHRGKG